MHGDEPKLEDHLCLIGCWSFISRQNAPSRQGRDSKTLAGSPCKLQLEACVDLTCSPYCQIMLCPPWTI